MRRPNHNGLRIPFRVSLAAATACLIILTSAVILLVVYHESRKAAEANAEIVYARIAEEVSTKLDGLLRESSEWATFGAAQQDMLQPLRGETDDQPAFTLLLGLVRKNPTMYSAYIGHADGAFLQAIAVRDQPALRRALDAPPGTDYVRRIVGAAGAGRVDRWSFFDRDNNLLERRDIRDADFDPRSRPWYIGSRGKTSPYLTAPYVFNSTKGLGITVSQALPGGRGAFGIDLTLDGLSSFLIEQELSPNGQIYLFDETFRIWGARAPGQSPPPPLADIRASQRPEVRRLAHFASTVQEPTFRISDTTMLEYVTPLMAVAGSKLALAITAPTADFTAHLRATMNRIFLAASAVLIGALPLAFFLATRLSRALQRLAGDAERLRQFDFTGVDRQPSVIREIDSLGRSFELMKTALQARTGELSDAQRRLEKLVELGIRLSAERDSNSLMESILRGAKELCNADGGTLYLRTDQDTLRFTTMLTDSLGIFLGGTSGKEINLPPVAMHDPTTGTANHNNVASHAAITGESVNIPDAYEAEGFDFSGTRKFDASMGYRSMSFLTVPMKNRQGRVMGVLQLLNAMERDSGAIIPFAKDIEGFVMALATQAAVALENSLLLEEQKALLDSFIELIASAIDAKSPYTGGHCARVPQVAKWLAEAACASADEPFRDFSLSEDDWYEFHIGAWLHDCGKVTTPEYVVDKATKLESIYNRIHEIRMRFEVLIRDAHIAYWQGVAEGRDAAALGRDREARLDRIREDFAFIAKANVGVEFMDTADKERVKAIAGQTWLRHLDDRLGLSNDEETRYGRTPAQAPPVIEYLLADKPEHIIERPEGAQTWGDNPYGFKMDVPEHLYNRGEIYNLCIDRGTLTREERFKINDHIIQTIVMLEQLPFPKHLARVPEIAGGHHETLIGTGYPRKLKKEEMSLASRIMAIADIFEALTASDRPYKKAKTLSESLRILSFMRNDQHIDPDLFDLFLTSGVYHRYAETFLDPEQIDTVNIEDYLRRKA